MRRQPNADRTQRKSKGQKYGKLVSGRFRIISIIFFVCLAALVVKLVWIFAFDGDKYAKAALAQSETATTTITAKRGDIIDRNNVQLVTSTKVYISLRIEEAQTAFPAQVLVTFRMNAAAKCVFHCRVDSFHDRPHLLPEHAEEMENISTGAGGWTGSFL